MKKNIIIVIFLLFINGCKIDPKEGKPYDYNPLTTHQFLVFHSELNKLKREQIKDSEYIRYLNSRISIKKVEYVKLIVSTKTTEKILEKERDKDFIDYLILKRNNVNNKYLKDAERIVKLKYSLKYNQSMNLSFYGLFSRAFIIIFLILLIFALIL